MISPASGSLTDVEGRLAFEASGVVLCGGRSVRMGSDKALLELEGRTLLEHAVATLRALTPHVFLATGPAARYPELGLERVLDRAGGAGPLAGLCAALEHARARGTRWLLALACDVPHVRPQVFRALHARAQREGAQACLLETEEGLEPLIAVYSTECLPAVERALLRGEKRLIAFHEAPLRIARLALAELPRELAADCTRNLNTPEEFRAAGGVL